MGRPLSVSKSLAEFAARRRQRNKIIFSLDMCVRENTSQAASAEFVRLRRTNYARSRLQTLCRKNPEGFSTVSTESVYTGSVICSPCRCVNIMYTADYCLFVGNHWFFPQALIFGTPP